MQQNIGTLTGYNYKICKNKKELKINRKGKSQLSLFTDTMILYKKNLKTAQETSYN